MPKKRGRKPKPKEDRDQQEQQQQSAGSKMKEGKKSQQQHQQPTVDEKYGQWKTLVPVLYDWLANHNLVWPSLSCRYFVF